jgi:hypothetical protein
MINSDTRREIDITLKTQDKLGKKSFKDMWISSGWLSRDRLGTITFKPILGNSQYNKFKGKS